MIYVNGVEELSERETIDELLTRRGMNKQGVAVAINGDVAPRSTWSTTLIPEGAHVEVVTAAAGG
jgi:sulfur carrier protein